MATGAFLQLAFCAMNLVVKRKPVNNSKNDIFNKAINQHYKYTFSIYIYYTQVYNVGTQPTLDYEMTEKGSKKRFYYPNKMRFSSRLCVLIYIANNQPGSILFHKQMKKPNEKNVNTNTSKNGKLNSITNLRPQFE